MQLTNLKILLIHILEETKMANLIMRTTKLEKLIEDSIEKYNLLNKPDSDGLYLVKEELKSINKALEQLTQEEANFYEVEKPMVEELTDHLEKEKYKLEIVNKIGAIPIDLSFLSRTKEFEIPIDNQKITLNLPIFATYEKNNRFEIILRKYESLRKKTTFLGIKYEDREAHIDAKVLNYGFNSEHNLNDILGVYTAFENNKNDNLLSLDGRLKEVKSLILTSEFYGIVPREVKQKISLSDTYFTESIYIIAEADYSEVEILNPMRRSFPIKEVDRFADVVKQDSLIIRFDKEFEEPYLVALFDCRPLMHYGLGEFSLNKQEMK